MTSYSSGASVGIFWLFREELLVEKCSLARAEAYGSNLGFGGSHIDCWEKMQKAGEVPMEIEYEEPPRGRVIYDPEDESFAVLADRCILGNAALIKRIMQEFSLPRGRTYMSADPHYRCAVCLGTERDE